MTEITNTFLGFELGSTRIKATLIDEAGHPVASGSHAWENKLVDGVWTYDMDDVWSGTAACWSDLAADVARRFGAHLATVAAGGFSGMMHGYVALDADGELLAPFRTWRNNITGDAAAELTDLFQFAIPQRWSIAHLYQAIKNGEEHLPRLAHLTTLAGYVHWKLTGRWVMGPCEASGMFPVDPRTGDFDAAMVTAFDTLVADREFPWRLRNVLPEIVPAGETAGTLTEAGARLLDPRGTLQSGIPLCAPEGDAGTGMVATNSVRPRTGNVSAGTSVFAMIVLEKSLSKLHTEIDIVLTPDGKTVGMAHSNNCTSDFDAWIALLGEAARALGADVTTDDLYARLMPLALEGAVDGGGVLSYPYVSGEHVTGFSEGRPLVVRRPDVPFTPATFLRSLLYSSLGALRTGLNILMDEEGAQVDEIRGHGGFFKTPEVGQRIMAAATRSRVSVMETAGEGGAWGMALLAAFTTRGDRSETLADYLDRVFASSSVSTVEPTADEIAGFAAFFERYTRGLAIERAAVETLP